MLQHADAPRLAIIDWMMPGLDGLELCRRLRRIESSQPAYLILLTARGQKEDIVQGLQSGADDYVVKPFDPEELKARVQAGVRIVELQKALAERLHELEEALTRVKELRGLLPICMFCKRIRNDRNYWQEVEAYISSHFDAQFSHGICPDCYAKAVAEGAAGPETA